MKYLFILPVGLLILSACRETEGVSPFVARLGDYYLSEEELHDYIVFLPTESDSSVARHGAIKRWALEKLLLEYASATLEKSTSQAMQIERLTERYRNSLIIHHFEKQYSFRAGDTIISHREIAAAYKKYMHGALATSNLYNGIMLAIPNSLYWKHSSLINKNLARSTSDVDTIALIRLCRQNPEISINFDGTSWRTFRDINENFPLTMNENLLKTRGYFFISHEKNFFFYRALQLVLRGTPLPIEMLIPQLKELILIQKQKERMALLKNSLFQKAVKNQRFQIYGQ